MSSKRVAITLALIAGLLGLIGAVSLVVWFSSVLRGRQPNPIPTAVIIQKVQALSQLVTVKYVMEQVVVYEPPAESSFDELLDKFGFGRSKLMLLAHAEVKAGIDFSRLTTNDIVVSQNKIVLTLPKPAILDNHLVESRTQVLDWKNGLLRGFDKNLEQKARMDALQRIRAAARQAGIENDAAQRAGTQLTSFLQALGFSEVVIQVRSNNP